MACAHIWGTIDSHYCATHPQQLQITHPIIVLHIPTTANYTKPRMPCAFSCHVYYSRAYLVRVAVALLPQQPGTQSAFVPSPDHPGCTQSGTTAGIGLRTRSCQQPLPKGRPQTGGRGPVEPLDEFVCLDRASFFIVPEVLRARHDV
jgi:hypothetical protein